MFPIFSRSLNRSHEIVVSTVDGERVRGGRRGEVHWLFWRYVENEYAQSGCERGRTCSVDVCESGGEAVA